MVVPDSESVEGPCGSFAPGKGLSYVLLFLVYQLRDGTNSSGPTGEGVKHTVLIRQVVVDVPMQVLVSVGRFSVGCGEQGIVWSW